MEREFVLTILEELAKFEVVFCVQLALHIDVVLDQLEELLFKLVDLVSKEEGIHESEVDVLYEVVIPNLLRHKK